MQMSSDTVYLELGNQRTKSYPACTNKQTNERTCNSIRLEQLQTELV